MPEKILNTTGIYPCQWDDLIDEKQKVVATVYTLEDLKEFVEECRRTHQPVPKVKPGITKGSDNIYDIVIDAKELTKENVSAALKDLSKITGMEYKLL